MWDKIKEKYYYVRNSLKWWNFKWSVWAFFKYFKIVITMRPWDSSSILEMMKFQLEILKHNILNGIEILEHRIVKVRDIERCIQIIERQLDTNYYYEVAENKYGKLSSFEDTFSMVDSEEKEFVEVLDKRSKEAKVNDLKVYKYADMLEAKEFAELFRILDNGDYIKKRRKIRGGLKSWWN